MPGHAVAGRRRGHAVDGPLRSGCGCGILTAVTEDDPFERIFDEDFIAAAPHREPSAEERIREARRRERQRAREIEERRLRRRRRGWRRSRSWRRSPFGVALLVFSVIVGAAVAHDVLGGEGGESFLQDDRFVFDGEITRYPPRSDDEEDERILPEPAEVEVDGPPGHRLIGVDERTGTPYRYNPCRPIPIVVNGGDRLDGGLGLLTASLDRVTAVTGLSFRIEGSTTEAPGSGRAPVQERYGNRWAPVLVAFTDPETVPALEGEVAGLGGSQPVTRGSRRGFVTGIVFLDTPDLERILEREGGTADVEAIIVHELGHLVGLDHVDDPDSIMYPENRGQTELSDGDRAGFAEVGRGGCLPGL